VTNALRGYLHTHLVRGGAAGDEPGLTWFRTGAPHEELNGVLRCSPDRLDAGMRAVAGIPALWHSWPGDPEFDIADQLLARGFAFVEEEPLLTVALDAVVWPDEPSAATRIRPVSDRAALEAWVRVWTGLRPEPGVVDALASAGLGEDASVVHLLAWDGDEPVGCAASVLAGDTVAVEHVVTVTAHRRRGIGSLLTAAALRAGRQHGARAAVLTASPDGAALYRRLGFRESAEASAGVGPRTVQRFAHGTGTRSMN
jgi:ribosomal protein S18 acetylase RimI-like enzyme